MSHNGSSESAWTRDKTSMGNGQCDCLRSPYTSRMPNRHLRGNRIRYLKTAHARRRESWRRTEWTARSEKILAPQVVMVQFRRLFF